jgi:hypothetical protein
LSAWACGLSMSSRPCAVDLADEAPLETCTGGQGTTKSPGRCRGFELLKAIR